MNIIYLNFLGIKIVFFQKIEKIHLSFIQKKMSSIF